MSHDWRCSFVTLTYADPHLPGGRHLVPAHLSGWLKRLRFAISYNLLPDDHARAFVTPAMLAGCSYGTLRYFASGEYGLASGRPHYHANIFGLAPNSVIGDRTFAQLVKLAWPYGERVKVLPMQAGAARYVAKYVGKGLDQASAPRLHGRPPEFRRYSDGARSKPALGSLGALAVPALIAGHDRAQPDVERTVALGRDRQVFLDRYLADRLRKAVGFSEERIADLASARLLALRDRSVEQRWSVLTGAAAEGPRFKAFAAYWSSRVEIDDD